MNALGRKLVGSVTAITLAILTCLPGCADQTYGIVPPPNIPRRQPNVVSLDSQDWVYLLQRRDGSAISIEEHDSAGVNITCLGSLNLNLKTMSSRASPVRSRRKAYKPSM
jgi:hypothetical protein